MNYDVVSFPVFLAIIGWLLCGILNYGFMVAYSQRTYSLIAEEYAVDDRIYAGFFSLTGPIGLLGTLLNGEYNKGWML